MMTCLLNYRWSIDLTIEITTHKFNNKLLKLKIQLFESIIRYIVQTIYHIWAEINHRWNELLHFISLKLFKSTIISSHYIFAPSSAICWCFIQYFNVKIFPRICLRAAFFWAHEMHTVAKINLSHSSRRFFISFCFTKSKRFPLLDVVKKHNFFNN